MQAAECEKLFQHLYHQNQLMSKGMRDFHAWVLREYTTQWQTRKRCSKRQGSQALRIAHRRTFNPWKPREHSATHEWPLVTTLSDCSWKGQHQMQNTRRPYLQLWWCELVPLGETAVIIDESWIYVQPLAWNLHCQLCIHGKVCTGTAGEMSTVTLLAPSPVDRHGEQTLAWP